MRNDSDEVAALAARIARHRNFPQAVTHYIDGMADARWRRTPALANKIMSQGSRIRLVLYLVWLHLAADPTDPDDGPTLARLTAICTPRGESSQGAILTTLGLMRVGRFIDVVHGTRDRRLRIYRPCPLLLDTVRDMVLRSFEAFDIVFEDAGWAERARHDDAFFRQVYVTCGRPFIDGEALVTDRIPWLHDVATMEGGFIVLLYVIKAQLDGQTLPSTVAIHRATTIPRTQVWKCIQRCAELDLLQLDQDGRIMDAGAAARVMATYIATEFAYYAVTMLHGVGCGRAVLANGPAMESRNG